MNPTIKWPGGKRKLVPELVANMPQAYGRYIEPFLGGGALFFHLEPRQAILGDSNERLISMYQALAKDWRTVNFMVGFLASFHSNDGYYMVRDLFNKERDPKQAVAQAARFIYLNKVCFNGLWRVNSKGGFNVPVGSYKNPSFPSADDLRCASELLERSSLRCANYSDTIMLAEAGDFVYCDPPYDLPPGHHNYTAAGFDREEQEKLRDILKMKGNRGVRFMVSNADTEFIRDLYTGYDIVEVMAARSINRDGNGRGKITELLIRNY